MAKRQISRRSALETLFKTAAVAAGATAVDLGFLFKEASAATITNLKVLKLKLSGLNQSVFESEFGRITPLAPIQNITGLRNLANRLVKPGQGMTPGSFMGCQAYMSGAMGASGACPALEGCVYNTSNCPVMSECVGANICSGQDVGGGSGGGSGPDSCTGVNDCNGQDCSSMSSCGDNECAGQKCPNLSSCGSNKQSIFNGGMSTADLAGLLNQFRTDPYVQGLYRYFNTTAVNQVATQVNAMLQQRRTLLPSQIIR
jgi:hypothetical protein